MRECRQCLCFFPIPEDAYDYEAGKGDCVVQKKDEKGKYWLSKPTFETTETCPLYQKKIA